MIRKLLNLSAVVVLLAAGFVATGCASTGNKPSSLRGDEGAARTAYQQGQNRAYGYYGR